MYKIISWFIYLFLHLAGNNHDGIVNPKMYDYNGIKNDQTIPSDLKQIALKSYKEISNKDVKIMPASEVIKTLTKGELKYPLKFVKVTEVKNIVSPNCVRITLHNDAINVYYKDFEFVNYLKSATGTILNTKKFTIYKFIKPMETISFDVLKSQWDSEVRFFQVVLKKAKPSNEKEYKEFQIPNTPEAFR